MTWGDSDRWSDDDPWRRLGRPGGDWQGLRPTLDNPITWSVKIGRVIGIDVRVHAIFLIFVVVEILQALTQERGTTGPLAVWPMAAAMGALFALVLLHEFGHCLACRGTGGSANEILMWPLGGLAYCLPPNRWQAHLVTAGGGPAVNVVLGLAFALVLGFATGSWWGVAVPNPFDFGGLYEVGPSWPLMALYIAAHLNLVLLLFNLLPIFPLDGGRIAQALLWPKLGYARSMRYAVRVGYGGAVALLIAGLAMQMWMLVGIAIFGGITCWITHKQLQFTEDVLGFGPAGAPEAPPSRRRQRREERRARREAEERRRVDAILHKIHESGLQSLTRPEKRLLHRTTQKKRRSPPMANG